MSIWTRISETLSALASGEGLSALFDRLRGLGATAPERSVAFTIAVIALGAKMAKADGHVSRAEVSMFRSLFSIPPGDEANAARVFDLARQDVAGFESYAAKISAMFPGDNRSVLVDLLESLFHIAMADGVYHEGEDRFLYRVAEIFGVDDRCFRVIRGRFVADAPRDPYDVLNVAPSAPLDEVRAAWRREVLESHPDRMLARGVPPEAVKLAEQRLIAINRAWEEIHAKRAA